MQNCPPIGRRRPLASRGFTLVEIIIAVFIMTLLLMLAVPSLEGVLADKRLRRSLDAFNDLVRQAQERSVSEHRPYLIVLQDKGVSLRPEALAKDEEEQTTTNISLGRGETLKISLPASLIKKPPAEWIFWPSGICEPAVIEFNGRDGSWKATYSALTARPELTNYVAK